MRVGRRRAGQCDEPGEPFPHVRMGGEEGRRPDLILGTSLHGSIEGNHGGGIEAGGLHHTKAFEVGLRFMSTAIVQRTHRASPLQAPGEPAGHVAGDGGQQQRGGCLFKNGFGRMALIDMLEFVGEHSGQLFGAGRLFQQPALTVGSSTTERVIR